MPGNITIELEVEVDEETGEITAFKGDKAGTLTILSEAYMRYTSKTDFAIGKSLPLIM